jgi:hypothetical protein
MNVIGNLFFKMLVCLLVVLDRFSAVVHFSPCTNKIVIDPLLSAINMIFKVDTDLIAHVQQTRVTAAVSEPGVRWSESIGP